MSKYINADLLRKEIEKNKNMIDGLFTEGDDSVYDGEDDAYNRVLRIIDSLQQEQPCEDLDAFRREAAKDILCAMIHHQNSTDPIEVSIAIDIANELIRQLKGENENKTLETS